MFWTSVTYVPYDYCLWFPSDPHLEISAFGDVVVEILKEIFAFILLVLHNASGDWFPVSITHLQDFDTYIVG